MIGFHRFQLDELLKLIDNDASRQLSYQQVGLAKSQVSPAGYYTNTYHKIIGNGESVFDEAKQRIVDLEHLNWEGIHVHVTENRLTEGTVIITQSRMMGIWGLAISIVTEIIDQEDANMLEFGYIIGSTQHHVLRGEEAFILTYDKTTEEVKYTIYSYSKVNGLLMKLGTPFIRIKQRRFVRSATHYLKSIL